MNSFLRVTQPPGGASSDIFGTDSSSDAGSEAGEAEPVRKPYRYNQKVNGCSGRTNNGEVLSG
jgi:hypothetical protein